MLILASPTSEQVRQSPLGVFSRHIIFAQLTNESNKLDYVTDKHFQPTAK
jgi:hypothetical protein